MISLFVLSGAGSGIFRSRVPHLMFRACAATMVVWVVAVTSVHGQVSVGRFPHAPGGHQFSAGQLVDSIVPQVRQAVEDTNRMLLSTGSTAHVEVSLTAKVATKSENTTFYSDRPNHPFVSLSILFPVSVKLAGGDFSVSRMISVGLRLFCDREQAGPGSVRVEVLRNNNASNPNSFDDIFQYLDDQVRNRVSAALATNPALQGKCVAINSSTPFSQSPATLITITPPVPTGVIKGALPSLDRIRVTFLSIKRLPAHKSRGGGILYQQVENILLETWVGDTRRELGVFSMKEGDVVNLNLPAVELDAPPPLLSFIFNVFQLPSALTVNSASTSYSQKNNSSPRVYVLTIAKEDPTSEQRFNNTVPAYEITFSVAYTSGNARK